MTEEKIRHAIDRIIAEIAERDDEAAHGTEDLLYLNFVTHIASLDDYPEIARLAKLVLSTSDLDFHRWRA